MRLSIEIFEIDNGWTVGIEDLDNQKDRGRVWYFPSFGGCLAKLFELLKDIEQQLEA